MKNDHGYYLTVGKADELRLQRLNAMYNPETQAFLMKSGLKSGMRVLDVGCGSGIMSRWFAQQVGPTGFVRGVDNSQAQLDIALRDNQDMNNLQFNCCDVYDLESLRENFDIVFTRFLLIHVDKPSLALDQMVKMLKPGGRIVICDGIFDTYFSEPKTEAHSEWFRVANAMLSMNGRDASWGRKVLPELKNLGCKITDTNYFMPIAHTTEFKKDLNVHLMALRENIVKMNLATESELDSQFQAINKMAEDEKICCSLPVCMMVAGQK